MGVSGSLSFLVVLGEPPKRAGEATRKMSETQESKSRVGVERPANSSGRRGDRAQLNIRLEMMYSNEKKSLSSQFVHSILPVPDNKLPSSAELGEAQPRKNKVELTPAAHYPRLSHGGIYKQAL